jgi:hypothetical protein
MGLQPEPALVCHSSEAWPVADDLKPYDSVLGPIQVARLILHAVGKGNSAWSLVR